MIIPTGFRDTVLKCIEENKGAIFKNFFDEEENPRWEDILQCLHSEIKKDKAKNFSDDEKPYGNVLLSHDLYLVSHLDTEKLYEYFPRLIEATGVIRNLTGVGIQAIGPKVCIGPHKIDFHTDQWHAFALHSEGKAKWILADNQDGTGSYLEEFYPERGDAIFFPKGIWHRIETQDAPRGGIQFNVQMMPRPNKT
jgi:hypothetical protein